LLLAEKWVDRRLIEVGGENWDFGYQWGFHPTVIRLGGSGRGIRQDGYGSIPPNSYVDHFGGPHTGSINAVMLDRSVRRIKWGLTLDSLYDRQDLQLIDWSQIEP
jgi:hypothetical protein